MALEPRQTTLPAPYLVPSSQQFDGNKGTWSTFTIGVGSPPQNFRVLISTASSDAWIPIAQGCTQFDVSNCPELRGVEVFNSVQNPGFQSNESSTWSLIGLYAVDTEEHLNITGNGLHGYDTIQLGASQDSSVLSVNHSVVAAIPDKDIFLGQLGLGIQPLSFSSASNSTPSLLQSLKDNDQIPSLSFGYTAGNPYRLKGVDGSLILGGYDATRFTPNDLLLTFASDNAAPLTVGVQSIITSNSLQGVQSFTTAGYLSVVDTTVDELWLPAEVCDSMAEAFGLIHDSESDLYLLNDTIHAQLQEMNPNITFQLGNTAYNNGNSTNIVLPYSAFDMQVSWPIFQPSTNYFPIRSAANSTQYTIGRTLLQEAYLIVDYENQTFSLSQAAWPDPLPSPQIEMIQPSNTASASGTSSAESSLSGGAIAGIAIGGAVVVFIAVGVFIFFRRRRRRREHQSVPNNSNFPADYKPDFPVDANRGNSAAYADSSFYGKERKDTLRGRQNAQELLGNELREMDGLGMTRSELAATKPGEAASGPKEQVYEMSTDSATDTWHSGPRTPMSGTLVSSQPGTQSPWSPGQHPMSWLSQNGSRNGSQQRLHWEGSPSGSQHGSSTWSTTQGATYASSQSRPSELP